MGLATYPDTYSCGLFATDTNSNDEVERILRKKRLPPSEDSLLFLNRFQESQNVAFDSFLDVGQIRFNELIAGYFFVKFDVTVGN